MFTLLLFYVHTEPIVVTPIDIEAKYSRSIGSTESGPIEVDIPEFSDTDGPIR